MILRNNEQKLTQVILGSGTVNLNRDITNTIFIVTDQEYSPVGTIDDSVIGKLSTYSGREVIEMKFEGEKALEAINMVIEDLQSIRKTLITKEVE